jgi:hypothetical protein
VAQLQARIDWCVKDAEGRGGEIAPASATFGATIDKVGRVTDARFEPEGALASSVASCALELAKAAKLTPPEPGSAERRVEFPRFCGHSRKRDKRWRSDPWQDASDACSPRSSRPMPLVS